MAGQLQLVRTTAVTKSDERALLDDVAQGDMRAFRRLHALYYDRVFGFALRTGQRPDRADEIASDTMMVVWRSAARFEGRSKVSSWIFGIAYKLSMKYRHRFRNEATHVEVPETLATPSEVDALLTREHVTAALRQLPAELRTIVELTYHYGLSYPEIAEIVDCPVGTVKSRMSLARKRMRAHLEEAET